MSRILRPVGAGLFSSVALLLLAHCSAGVVTDGVGTGTDAGSGGGTFKCGSQACGKTQFCDQRMTAACVSLPAACSGKPSCDCITPTAPGCCTTDLTGNISMLPQGSCG